MEIDPDVAALLDDLPLTRLPQPLIDEGWGRASMQSLGIRPHQPSDIPAPTFVETCARCGRPITAGRQGYFVDHAGRQQCDGALVDQTTGNHMTAEGLRFEEALLKPVAHPITPSTSVCSAYRESHGCKHRCAHPSGHFGFHECAQCRRLWG